MAGAEHMEPPRIDYHKLSAALSHYESLGYQYMNVPWVVSHEAIAATLPPGREATAAQYGDLVGSGEQSFMELIHRGQAIIKACCITPCFRIEDSYDELHHAYFMKCELIDTDATPENVLCMVHDARQFYERYIETDVEQTGPDAYDIVDKKNRLELGSYGLRAFAGTEFIYGTGVALPRLDTVIQMADIESY